MDFSQEDGEEEEGRYVDEWGVPLPRWKPLYPEKRNLHDTFSSAAKAAFEELATFRDPFVETLADVWPTLFPDLRAVPGRFEDGYLILYVRSAPMLFSLKPKLSGIKKRLAALPDAPKKFEVRLEINTRAKK